MPCSSIQQEKQLQKVFEEMKDLYELNRRDV